MRELHITNGDSTVSLLKAADIQGEYLPWRDVLHMGPVPLTDSLEALSEIRADYLASLGSGELQQIKHSFTIRDSILRESATFDRITIWVEHDLYDQLQLLQILCWFANSDVSLDKLTLINPAKHLGYHTPEEAISLQETRVQVTRSMLKLAELAWLAYRQRTPDDWSAFLAQDTSVLPFLHDAIERSLMELPDQQSGLNATEQHILSLISAGIDNKIQLFREYSKNEPAAFHGDMGFFWYLEQLLNDSPQIIELQGARLCLTDLGRQVVSGETFWQRNYLAPQWLGGYRLDVSPFYYWNGIDKKLHRET